MRILCIVATLLLTACSSTQGLSIYSFTNSQLESALIQQLPKLREKINLRGFPLELLVNNVGVNIGPDNRDVILLSVDSSAIINAFVVDHSVSLSLEIEASPFYDSKKKAIYLRNIRLLKSTFNAGGFSGNLGLLDGEVMRLFNAFLSVNPVYTLDQSNPKIALLSAIPMNMKVVEGAIKLVPKL